VVQAGALERQDVAGEDDSEESGDHCTMSVRVQREFADRFARLAKSNRLSRSMLVRLMMTDALNNGLSPAVRAASDALRMARASV
jgi:hypothetical protein